MKIELVNEARFVKQGHHLAGAEASMEKWMSIEDAVQKIISCAGSRCGICQAHGFNSPAKSCVRECQMYDTCTHVDNVLMPALDKVAEEVATVVKAVGEYEASLEREREAQVIEDLMTLERLDILCCLIADLVTFEERG